MRYMDYHYAIMPGLPPSLQREKRKPCRLSGGVVAKQCLSGEGVVWQVAGNSPPVLLPERHRGRIFSRDRGRVSGEEKMLLLPARKRSQQDAAAARCGVMSQPPLPAPEGRPLPGRQGKRDLKREGKKMPSFLNILGILES